MPNISFRNSKWKKKNQIIRFLKDNCCFQNKCQNFKIYTVRMVPETKCKKKKIDKKHCFYRNIS